MQSIRDNLQYVLDNYLVVKSNSRKVSKFSEVYTVVVESLPTMILEAGNISNHIIADGSVGQGNMAGVPWICFFDQNVTTTAQSGFYVCVLFREDMKGFYISLNQGWTQYEREFGLKNGRQEIALNSQKARSILRSTRYFETDDIDLAATTSLGKGYQIGNIYSKYYTSGNLPLDKDILDDLNILLGAYRELKGVVGNNILNIRFLSSEEDYQNETQKCMQEIVPYGAVIKPEKKSISANTQWLRSPRIAKNSLEKAGFSCELNKEHYTFLSSATGNQFVEAHHLIPMRNQHEYDVSLDVPENIIALCPNCHRKIHLAEAVEKNKMLLILLNLRKDGLLQRGINIDIKTLEDAYVNEGLV